jgi:hypothetical protein
MKIEIRRRTDGEIILCGEYESIKDCLEKNRGADLRGAHLGGADLGGAHLRGADLRGAHLGGADLGGADLGGAHLRGADLRGANLGGADLGGADLRGADLRGAYLRGAYLRGAYLRGAYLRGAYLRGAREYVNSHDFLIAVIHQQKVETFTTEEWACIGQIYIHTLCWNSIHKRFKKEAMSIFEKLEKIGFGEWLVKFKEEI